MTPKAHQLLDRLNAEIDDRRGILRARADAQSGTAAPDLITDDVPALPAEHTAFFARLYRHHDLASLRKHAGRNSDDAVAQVLGNLHEPLEMLVGSAIQAHQLMGEAAGRLPYLNARSRQEVFSRLVMAKETIERHFSRDVPLDELAGIACLSRYHFLRLFKQAFGLTPHQYHLQCRLQHACQLLRDTELRASDVAYEVGFESHTSFAALFKRTYGLTPMAYRFRPDADSQF